MTVSVAVDGAAADVTVTLAVRVVPSNVAEIVTVVDVLTLLVDAVKVVVVTPGNRTTFGGTVTMPGWLLDSATEIPVEGAADDSLTLPCAVDPAVTLVGLTVTLSSETDGGGGAGGVTVSVADLVVPL